MAENKHAHKFNWYHLLISIIRYWWVLAITIALVAIAVLWRSCAEHPPVSLRVNRSTAIDLTAEEVRSIRDIGQWEFLSVTTEELLEWHQRRNLGNDHLVRIYGGTLRIGINMARADKDWFKSLPDSIARLTLPCPALLDSNFIDETHTRTFYQRGSAPPDTLEALYNRARIAMIRRCVTPQNIQAATESARRQFTRIFQNFGFKKVEIYFTP